MQYSDEINKYGPFFVFDVTIMLQKGEYAGARKKLGTLI